MSDVTGLTARQSELMAELREHKTDHPDSWYLFVNGGFKYEDARVLYDRGLIDGSFQMGMPAIRLRVEAKAEPTDAERIASLTKEVERLREAWREPLYEALRAYQRDEFAKARVRVGALPVDLSEVYLAVERALSVPSQEGGT